MVRQPKQPEQLHSRLAENLPHGAKVAIAVVDDPWPQYFGEQITVLRSIRNDPLAGMLAHDFIDQHQYLAGRLWQKHFEASQIGGAKAIDTTREAVDGGKMAATGLTDQQIRAFKELDEAKRMLGKQGNLLVFYVLAQGLSIGEIAIMRGYTSKRYRHALSLWFRQYLEDLAELWGFSTTHKR